MSIATWEFESPPLHFHFAEIAQLVEHNLAKVGVASSSLVFRSQANCPKAVRFFHLSFVFPTQEPLFILHL